MNDAATILGILAACVILCTLAVTFGRLAWHALWNTISRRIEHHMAQALARPLHPRYRDLDDEYRQLVLNAHNEGD